MRHIPPTYQAFQVLSMCLVVLLAQPAGSSAQTADPQEIGVEPVRGYSVSTLPGRHLTLAFKVSNSTFRIVRCTSDARLPDGWKLVARDTPFDVPSGGSEVRLLTFAVPATCGAGDYELAYSVIGDSTDRPASQAVLTVTVLPRRSLVLRTVAVPRFVVAGDEYTALFSLANEANVSTTALLKPRSVRSVSVSTDSSSLHLQPGERRTVALRSLTPSVLTGKVLDVIIMVATAAEDSLVSVSASASTDIVPRSATAVDTYHRLPLRATLRGAGENGTSGVQGELSGAGSFTETGSDYLDFLVRGPDLMKVSSLGPHDEYGLSYQRRGLDVFLGDQIYRLTPLTEYGRFAFGGGAFVDIDNFTVGGFYNRTRWTTQPQTEQAGSITYHAEPGAEVSLSYLGKTEDSRSSMLSLRTHVNPFSTNDIDLEYARGFIPSGTPAALSMRTNGREPWGSYDLQYLRAEPGFTGYYRDVEFINGNIILFPYQRFRIEALVRNESRNLDHDPRYYSAPRYQYYQFGAGYGNLLTVYYKMSATSDQLAPPRFDTHESSVMAIAGYGFPFGSLLLNAEAGRIREDVLQSSGPFLRLALFSSTTVASSYTVGVTLQYADEYNVYSRSPGQRFNGGLSLGAFLGSSTRLFASGTLTRFLNHGVHWYTILDASLEQLLPWGHQLSLRGRYTRYQQYGQGENTAWLAEYSVPLNFPASKKSSIGQLRGKLLDTETGKGVHNVLVSVNGSMALTDESGEFFFPAIAPGVYSVTVDQVTLGYERVLTGDPPTGIPVRGGEETGLTVGVVRSAQVTGVVSRFEFESATDTLRSQLREAGGQGGVLIELRSQGRFLRQLSDSRGRFELSGLPPGEWTLRILDGDIPEYHYFDPDSLTLRLAPGQRAEVTLKLLPKRRVIKMMPPG